MNTVFDQRHTQLAAAIEAAAGLPDAGTGMLADLRQRFAEHAFHLVVAGEFKRGKSTTYSNFMRIRAKLQHRAMESAYDRPQG